MIKNCDLPAMPAVVEELIGRSGNEEHYGEVRYSGLTKREQFAMVAMQGLLANDSSSYGLCNAPSIAVLVADALLAELEKSK